jgi:DNA-binding IclR family transcriptional regulator
MSSQALADHFGIQKYSLLRCLKEMQENGSIVVDGKYIKLLD